MTEKRKRRTKQQMKEAADEYQASLIEADKQYVEQQERLIDQEFKDAKQLAARRVLANEIAFQGKANVVSSRALDQAKDELRAEREAEMAMAELEANRAKLVSAIDKAMNKKRTKKVEAELVRLEKQKRKNDEEFEATKAMMRARDAADKITREREQRAYLDQLAAQSAAPTEIEAQMQYVEEISPEIDRYSRDRGSKDTVKLTRPKVKQRPRQMTLEDVTTDDPRISARLESFDSQSEDTLESMLKFTESELEDQPIGAVADEQDALDKLNLQLDKVALDIALEKKKLSKAPRKAPSKAERDQIRADAARAATVMTEKLMRDREESRAMTDLIIEQNRAYEEQQKILAIEEKLSRERQQSLEIELKQGLEQDVRASSEGRRRPTPIPARPLAERQRQRSVGEIKSELMKEDLKQEQINEQKIRLALEQEERDRLEAEERGRAPSPKRGLPPKRQRPLENDLVGISLDDPRISPEERARRIEAERMDNIERARRIGETVRSRSTERSRSASRSIDPSLLKRGIALDSDLIGLSLDDPRISPEERARRIDAERIDNMERARRIGETLRSRSAQRSTERIDPSLLKRGISFDSDLIGLSLDDPRLPPEERVKRIEAERIDNMERARRIGERLSSRAERDSRRSADAKLTKKAIQGSRERSEGQERARLASEEIARRSTSRGRSRERIDPRFKDRGLSIDSDLRPFSLDDPEPRGATEPRSSQSEINQAKSLIAERMSKQAEKDKPRILSRGSISLQRLQSDKMAMFQAQQKAASEGTSSTLALAVASAPVRASFAAAEQEAAARDKLLKQSRSLDRYSQEEALSEIESRRASQITQARARPTKTFEEKKLAVNAYQKAAREKDRGVPIAQSASITFRNLIDDPKETEMWFRRLQLTPEEEARLDFSRDKFYYKSGRGLKAKPKSWIEFGKYIINENMLDEGTLQVKTSKGSPIPGYSKKIALSDTLQGIIEDLLETGKLRGLSDLDDTERRYLETLLIKAGLAHGLGIKKVHQSDEDANKVKRFDLVKGIYDAGNNSTEVIHELRSLILYFIKTKRLNRKDGLEALQELQ